MKRSVIHTDMRRPGKLVAGFTTFMVVTAGCIGVLLFVFEQVNALTVLNAVILLFVFIIGLMKVNPTGWYGVVYGSAANALVFFISYCLVVNDYEINYMYAIGFAVCMFTVGYYARVPVQELHGLSKGPDRLEKEDFPHITKEEVM